MVVARRPRRPSPPERVGFLARSPTRPLPTERRSARLERASCLAGQTVSSRLPWERWWTRKDAIWSAVISNHPRLPWAIGGTNVSLWPGPHPWPRWGRGKATRHDSRDSSRAQSRSLLPISGWVFSHPHPLSRLASTPPKALISVAPSTDVNSALTCFIARRRDDVCMILRGSPGRLQSEIRANGRIPAHPENRSADSCSSWKPEFGCNGSWGS